MGFAEKDNESIIRSQWMTTRSNNITVACRNLCITDITTLGRVQVEQCCLLMNYFKKMGAKEEKSDLIGFRITGGVGEEEYGARATPHESKLEEMWVSLG